MARYNDEPAAGGEGTEEIEGYRAGVDRVIALMDMETRFQIRSLIDEGEI